jgi:uncharacterized protein YcfJ
MVLVYIKHVYISIKIYTIHTILATPIRQIIRCNRQGCRLVASQSSGEEDVAGKKEGWLQGMIAGGETGCRSERLWNGNLAFGKELFSAIFLTSIADH